MSTGTLVNAGVVSPVIDNTISLERLQITDAALSSGFKADAGKARFDLIPAPILRRLVRLYAPLYTENPRFAMLIDTALDFWEADPFCVEQYGELHPLLLTIDSAVRLRSDLSSPITALFELGELYDIGARKYAARNWEQGMDWGRVFSALLRHALKFASGETHDAVDGQHHLTSVVWCAVALLHFDLNRERYAQFDTRAQVEIAAERGQV